MLIKLNLPKMFTQNSGLAYGFYQQIEMLINFFYGLHSFSTYNEHFIKIITFKKRSLALQLNSPSIKNTISDIYVLSIFIE